MQNITSATIVPIGNYDWYVLRLIGNKYFVLAESPLFRGYYDLEPCQYKDSRLASFLNNKFTAQLKHNGVDTSKISNISVLTAGQYQMYVKDKLPASASSYMLQTAHPEDKNSILAVNAEGDLYPSGITTSCGIRPCMFIDKDYLDSISGINPNIITGVSVGTENKPTVIEKSDTESVSESNDSPVIENETQVQSNIETNNTEADKTKSVKDEKTEPDNTVITEPEVEKEDTVNVESKETETVSNNETTNETITKESGQNVIEVESVDVPDPESLIAIIAENKSDDPEETSLGSVETPDKTVQITSIGNSKAAYLFEEKDYSRFAVMFEGQDTEVKKVLSEYGLTVTAFLRSSVVEDRKPIKAEDVQAFMEQQMKRFRWRRK